MTTAWFIAARAVHFGACLVFFGAFAFDRLVAASILTDAPSAATEYWRSCLRRLSLLLLPFILISGLAWFVAVAAAMSGLPLTQATKPDILTTVWTQTEFGAVWKLRLMFWIAATGALAVFWRSSFRTASLQRAAAWIQLVFGGLLTGSLAWAGHGLEDSRWHLFADVLHLLVAGLWPAGLLPFLLLLRRLSRTEDSQLAVAKMVRRFSAVSLASVALLTLTGLVNTCFLVGSIFNLLHDNYGRFLLFKILLFAIAVGIGAINLLRLKPRFTTEPASEGARRPLVSQLRFNVQAELLLGTVIIILVAVLGLLPPASH